jgi:hypothetical protein
MLKKPFLLVMLFAFMCLASGCVTIYNQECCPDKDGQCIKKAAKGEKGPNIVKKADDWVKKNIW